MNINYKLIEGEISKLDKKLIKQAAADSEGKKFSLLMLKRLSNYRGRKLLSCYCDGSGDHQIDGVYYSEGKDNLVINLITCIFKSNARSSFDSKDITDLINGIKYLLFGGDEPSDINQKLKSIKSEIDDQKEFYKNDVAVNLKFITSTDNVVPANSRAQLTKFQNEINASGQQDLTIEEINGQNVSALFSSRKVINVPVPIKLSGKSYYLLTGKDGFICRLPVAEIIKAYLGFEEDGKNYKGYGDFLFTDNVRKDLGVERKINQKIYETATHAEEFANFEYYNNGLTIIYDDMSGSISGDSPKIYFKGLQVVNGCQTVNTILKAHKEGKLQEDLYLTCRFIKRTTEDNFIQSVITYTNSQNAITERDLHSNDKIQYSIQTILKNFGVLYERKLNEFRDEEQDAIVDALDAAQAYLCCEMKKPHRAKQDKRKIFGKLYIEIFDESKPDLPYRLFVSYLILEAVLKKQLEHSNKKRKTQREGKTPKYKIGDLVISHGSYHVASKIYHKNFDQSTDIKELERVVKCKKMPFFENDYKEIVNEISSFMESKGTSREDFAKYFKSNALMA